jgi:hypothetical protein
VLAERRSGRLRRVAACRSKDRSGSADPAEPPTNWHGRARKPYPNDLRGHW